MKYCLSLCLLLGAAGLRAQNVFPSTGAVGIGTNTPSSNALLHIHGGNLKLTNPGPYPYGVNIDVTTASGAWAREFSLSAKQTGKLASFGAYGGADTLIYAYIGGNTASDIAYAAPWMVFRPDGNVGIGTMNTYTRLSVDGGVTILSPGGSAIPRPPVSAGTITGEIRGTSPGWYAGDDGFLRLSAGGGTSAGTKSFIDLSGYTANQPDRYENIVMGTAGQERIRIASNGNVGIGTNNPDVKLAVNGDIRAKRVKVTATNWPDYVFHPSYQLPGLMEVADFIHQHQHLPGVPSQTEVQREGSVDVGAMNETLLKKIEELTLYMIELKKENISLANRLRQLETKQR
ncbi:hypothetical protein [Chitinophaga polysaccharea]|uniref:hypothetical protein n=1 Tax=Chitinophaga polysaccharea TaxID=1293035 RepID=UPI00163C27A7|nr:hypothetical protein [Chitinophaga polysaccharea]